VVIKLVSVNDGGDGMAKAEENRT